MKDKIVVVGSGDAAVAAVGRLAQMGHEVVVVDNVNEHNIKNVAIPLKPYHMTYMDSGPIMTGREKRRERRKLERDLKKRRKNN